MPCLKDSSKPRDTGPWRSNGRGVPCGAAGRAVASRDCRGSALARTDRARQRGRTDPSRRARLLERCRRILQMGRQAAAHRGRMGEGGAGTDGRRYPWGDAWDTSKANGEGKQKGTTPAGSHPQGASIYGAQDMAGNVWELVADWYDENYYRTGPALNPTGPETGDFHIARGGAWLDHAATMMTTHRNRIFSRLRSERHWFSLRQESLISGRGYTFQSSRRFEGTSAEFREKAARASLRARLLLRMARTPKAPDSAMPATITAIPSQLP